MMTDQKHIDLKTAASGQWCWLAGVPGSAAGFRLFRRRFTCETATKLELYISADCRFKLYLDGRLLELGPVKSDIWHYQLHPVQVPNCSAGDHVLSVEVIVWDSSWPSSTAPWSELHIGGGLYVAGGAPGLDLSTPQGWKGAVDHSRRTLAWAEASQADIFPAGPRDGVDFRQDPGDWKSLAFDETGWTALLPNSRPYLAGYTIGDICTPWLLELKTTASQCRTHTPIAAILVDDAQPLHLSPAGEISGCIREGHHRILLDLGRNQTSLIHLAGSGATGTLRIASAEKLPASGVIGRTLPGDLLTLTEKPWSFDSFELRPGRYFELDCQLEQPLRLLRTAFDFICYDFGAFREFRSPDDPELERIYRLGVHTACCCAHDTYEDCPFYERFQYEGDTRIQALISYQAAGHGALGRKAILDFFHSRQSCGLTLSRYPDRLPQLIPGYSLIWVLMIEDYERFFPDLELLRECYPAVPPLLQYFEQRLDPATGLVGPVGFWDFTDWVALWPNGKSNRNTDLPEAINTLFYALALNAAAGFAQTLGLTADRNRYRRLRRALLQAVNRYCFDPHRGLYTDVPGKPWFSRHTNALAILADAVSATRRPTLVTALTEPADDVIPCSLYFQFYVLEALRKLGAHEAFLKALAPWRECLTPELTTFPEVPGPKSRSQCHAWSAAPVYELLAEQHDRATAATLP